MKKISVYISNPELKPSNYYRVYQYLKDMPQVQIHCTIPTFLFKLSRKCSNLIITEKIIVELMRILSIRSLKKFLKQDLKNKPDYVVVQKSMTKYKVPEKTEKMMEELVKETSLIWDFDDDILEGNEISKFEYDLFCKYSKNIIVTSEFLKNTIHSRYHNKVSLLATSDMEMPIKEEELFEINKQRKEKMKNEIDVVWVATGGNLHHLKSVLNVLDEAAKELKDKQNKILVLKVICNKKINKNYKNMKIENIKWTRSRAIQEVRTANIGIMPLKDNEYSKGKGGFKLIQYISTGLPVIASNVGYNQTIFKDDIGFLVDDSDNKEGWKDAILELVSSEQKWETYSKNAYDVWKKYYNYEYNINFWKELIK